MSRLAPSERPLNGKEIKAFRDALVSAMPSGMYFAEMLITEADRRLATLTNPELPLPSMVLQVIEAAEAKGWSRELLDAAIRYNQGNPELKAFAVKFKLDGEKVEPSEPEAAERQPALERMIQRDSTWGVMADVAPFHRMLSDLEAKVCRIERADKTARGTGFLIGPSAILTAYSAAEDLVKGEAGPATLVRFGYRAVEDGSVVEPGTVFRLADDPIIHFAPYSKCDLDPNLGEPGPDELDYVVLRVKGRPDAELRDRPGKMRGWIKAPADPPNLAEGAALSILGHPRGEPLKLTINTNSIIGVVAGGQRVRYRTLTEPGSGGAPCFDVAWNLAAMHHMGDPGWGVKRWNEGILISAIVEHLKANGKWDEIGN